MHNTHIHTVNYSLMLTVCMHKNTHMHTPCSSSDVGMYVDAVFLCFLLLLLLLLTSVTLVNRSGARCPEDDSSICRRGQEGPVVGVPPTLDHLVPVLPCHSLREGLC